MNWSRSLRLRLVLFTVAVVGVIWLPAAAVTWREANHELVKLLYDHPADERDEIAEEIAEHLIKPILYALPALALALGIAVTLSLRPLNTLANEVARRDPERLDPLPETGPQEIAPLVTRLNALFARIVRTLDSERRFTADAAHELRTPLAAIVAQAQVASAARDEAERAHALTQLAVSAERASRLIDQLLTLARMESAPQTGQTLCRLDELLLESAVAHGPEAISKGIALEISEREPAPVRGDAVLLRVLLRNLIDNALRYTPADGRVVLSVQVTAAGVQLCVTDSGPGIAPAQRPHALQRFVRLAGQELAGSGLGLAIVQRIAEVHGARLHLADGLPGSAPGQHGLAVRVVFPATTG